MRFATDEVVAARRPRHYAAWTETEPSGVAVAVETEAGWRLGAVEASYEHFIARADGIDPGEARPRGSKPSAAALLRAAEKLSAWPVALVAIDMPLAPYPIVGRRPCDEAISAAFGAKGAATHSPSAIRPGRISDESRGEFAALGYPLCGQTPARGLIEVYPHAALIQFMREGYRLPYKAEKISKYWPDLAPDERRAKLQSVWARIVKALESRIAGVAAALPLARHGRARLALESLRGQTRRRRLRRGRHRLRQWQGPRVWRQQRRGVGSFC